MLPLGLCSFHPKLVFRVIFSDVPPSLLLLTCVRGGASQELLFTAPPSVPRRVLSFHPDPEEQGASAHRDCDTLWDTLWDLANMFKGVGKSSPSRSSPSRGSPVKPSK